MSVEAREGMKDGTIVNLVLKVIIVSLNITLSTVLNVENVEHNSTTASAQQHNSK